MIFFRADDHLFDDRMLDSPFDENGHGFLHFVANDPTLQGAAQRLPSFRHLAIALSVMMVLMRAMSLRSLES